MRSGIDNNGREWNEINLSPYMKDLSNQRFNMLNVLFPVMCNNKKQWLCKCDCGNYVVVSRNHLTSGNTKSCGCLLHNVMTKRWEQYREDSDVIGEKFGRLTTVAFVGVKNKEAIYHFKCECGNDVELSMHSVKQGVVKSCGCLKQDLMDFYKTDIVGVKFGHLLALHCVGTSNRGHHEFECLCDCGEYVVVDRNSLTRGLVQSCGCIRSVGENNIKNILTNENIKYKQQYTFLDLLSMHGRALPYDFAIIDDKEQVIRLIEFDGPQHVKPYDYFGGEEKFLRVKGNDSLKNQYAISHNIPLVRIPYSKRDAVSLDDLFGETYLINTIGVCL